MNRQILKKFILCALMTFVISAGHPGYAFAEGEDASDNNLYLVVNADYDKARDVVSAVNSERKERGLASLDEDQTLMDAAMIRAAEIVLYFEHARPNGGSWSSVDPKVTGENLGRGSGSTSRLMSLWMESQGHRENILRSRFDSIGVAVVEYEGIYYWVQLFGSSPGYGAEYPENGPVSVALDLPSAEEGGDFALDYEISIDGAPQGAGALADISWKESVQLGLSGDPLTFDPSKVHWELSDPAIADIDDAGVLTPKDKRKTTLTAYSGEIYRAEIEIDTRVDIRKLCVLDAFPSPKVLSEEGPLEEWKDFTAVKEPAEEGAPPGWKLRGINGYKGIVNPVN